MMPHTTDQSAQVSDRSDDAFASTDIVGALLDALNSAGAYRLIERDGEFFIEPTR
jgi:hypothetical protein